MCDDYETGTCCPASSSDVIIKKNGEQVSSAREKKHPNPSFKYTRKDAENAIKYTNKWETNKVNLFDVINRGVSGLNRFKMKQQGAWLLEECLKQIELEPYDKGLCLNKD